MSQQGLITAFILDGKGGGQSVGWDGIRTWKPAQGTLWVHLNYKEKESYRWIFEESGLPLIGAEALVSEETRPRTTVIGNAALLALRGVNLNPNAEPEDMVALRIWVTPERIITSRERSLQSATDIARLIEEGVGPGSAGDFLVELINHLTLRIETPIEEAEEKVDELEEDVVTTSSKDIRYTIRDIRRSAILLRRYLAPQREAMIKLSTEKIPWFTELQRLHLREATDSLIRHIEDLDAVRDRAAIIQEELISRNSEQMNQRMYVLSLVAAVFLPLGFLTGLLGINIGGIPGADNPWAFFIFLLIIAVIILLQLLYFKKRKWL